MNWDYIPRAGFIDGHHHAMVCYPSTQPKVTFVSSQADDSGHREPHAETKRCTRGKDIGEHRKFLALLVGGLCG